MAKDLHSFLKNLQAEHPSSLVHIDKPIDPAAFDATAILEHPTSGGAGH